MGMWRTDVWIKKNDDEGNEITTAKYNRIAVAKTFSFSSQNNWKVVKGMGSKFPLVQAAGKYAVSGTLKTNLDYNNFYHLIGAFEDYEPVKVETTSAGVIYKHQFKKSNLQRIPSFTMIARKLNRKVGGGYDENVKFERVYFKGISLTWEQSNPLVNVSYDWVAVIDDDEFDDIGTLELLDEEGKHMDEELNTPLQIEWGCLSYATSESGPYTPIATNEKTKMAFTTTIGEIGQCGSRFPSDFNEQGTGEVTTESSVYSRDGHWMKRLLRGGDLTEDELNAKGKFSPKRKHLATIPYMRISSFNDENEFDKSKYRLQVTMKDVMVKGMNQDYGASGAITDTPTLTATRAWLDIYTPDIDFNIYTGQAIGGTALTVTNPLDDFAITEDPNINVTGTTEVGATVNMILNKGTAVPLTVDAEGKFSMAIELTEGNNTIIISSTASGKGTTQVTLNGTYYRTPALSISAPTEGQVIAEATTDITILTDMDDNTKLSFVTLNGSQITNLFTKSGQEIKATSVPIQSGSNELVVRVTRIGGLFAEDRRSFRQQAS